MHSYGNSIWFTLLYRVLKCHWCRNALESIFCMGILTNKCSLILSLSGRFSLLGIYREKPVQPLFKDVHLSHFRKTLQIEMRKALIFVNLPLMKNIWAPSSEFVSSSIPSWQTLTAHAQPFRGARDLAFCLKVPLDSLLVWASSGGSGETARMRRLAWTFAARICDKYQICLTRSISCWSVCTNVAHKRHKQIFSWCGSIVREET